MSKDIKPHLPAFRELLNFGKQLDPVVLGEFEDDSFGFRLLPSLGGRVRPRAVFMQPQGYALSYPSGGQKIVREDLGALGYYLVYNLLQASGGEISERVGGIAGLNRARAVEDALKIFLENLQRHPYHALLLKVNLQGNRQLLSPGEEPRLKEAMDPHLAQLPAGEREALNLAYGLEDHIRRSRPEIAKLLAITPRQASQLESRGVRGLQKAAQAELKGFALVNSDSYASRELGVNFQGDIDRLSSWSVNSLGKESLEIVEYLNHGLGLYIFSLKDLVTTPWNVIASLGESREHVLRQSVRDILKRSEESGE